MDAALVSPVASRRSCGRRAAFATVGLLLTAACVAVILLGESDQTRLLLVESESSQLIGDHIPNQFVRSDSDDARLPAIVDAVRGAIDSGRNSCSNKKKSGDKLMSVRVLSARHQFVSRDDREYEVEVESIDVHGFLQIFIASVRWRHAADALILRVNGSVVEERAQVISVKPHPCDLGDAATLVLTSPHVDHINAQKLPWTAALSSRFRGVSLAEFKHLLGYKPDSAKFTHLAADVLSSTPGVVLPVAFDARDTRTGEAACVAFQPKNQGSCGSCYAFGSTSALAARLCMSSKRAINFDLSFQEVMDCTDGCDGGTAGDVYNTLYTKPTVPSTCDSYSAVYNSKSCGVYSCAKPFQVFAQADSYRVHRGVSAMQQELLVNGPGPVAFVVYDDFAAYSSVGVYSKSKGAKEVGRHMVLLVGWGVDSKGTPYWLLQNSWSDSWGDGGFFKMKRGVDECEIEGTGMMSAKPKLGTTCSAACQNGGVQYADCSCECLTGYSGKTCELNNLKCGSGLLDPTGKLCVCPTGFTGKFCQNTVSVSNVAVCRTSPSAQWPIISWDFSADSSLAPPAGSRILVFPAAVSNLNTAPANSVLWYPALPAAQLFKGKFQLPALPLAEGTYVVYLIRSLGKNEFGQDKGFPGIVDASSILSHVYVVSCASVAAANVAMSASAQLKGKVDAVRSSMIISQIAKDQRLDAADAARKAISKLPPPIAPLVFLPTSSFFSMMNGAYLVYASTPSYRVCYEVDITINIPRKILAVRPAGSTDTYAATYTPVLSDNSACATMSIPWTGSYDVALLAVDAKGAPEGSPFAVSAPIKVVSAMCSIAGYSYRRGTMSLVAKWHIDLPFFNDWVGVFNSKGNALVWIYTASKNQAKPKALSATSAESTFTFTIYKSALAVAGDTWTLRYYPAGDATFYVAAGNKLVVPSNF